MSKTSHHPLEANGSDDEDFEAENAKKDQNKIDEIETLINKAKNKRQAPKRPDQIQLVETPQDEKEKKFANFFIPIENVRWFYKGDKETGSSNNQANTSNTTDSTSPNDSNLKSENSSSSANLASLSAASNDINNNANANLNVHHISSKKWYMFSKWDSYNLESEYRDMITKKQMNISSADEPKLVQVLDNLYEVNLITKKCNPIYWKGRNLSITRGIWFIESSNEIMDDKIADEIEKKHLELFKESLCSTNTDNPEQVQMKEQATSPVNETAPEINKTPSKSSSKPTEPIATITVDEGTITWFSHEEVYYEKNKASILEKFIKQIGRQSGVKIKRGYKEKSKEAELEEKPKEIGHLVFVVHGIAQKLYENSIVKNCEDLRKECDKKKKDCLALFNKHRYMFLPVDWRSSLTLDDGIVETITPKSIQMIRDRLNSSALDIMYYTSPLFRTEIINSLVSELNRLYRLFVQKNPTFEQNNGKVSFVAHSLGTVIVYDILTSNNPSTLFSNHYGEDSTQEKMMFNHFSHNDSKLLEEYLSCKKRMEEIEKSLIKQNECITSLDFKTENFFLLGSPLAVFLALRGVRPAGNGTQDHILPKHLCKRLFNIFHPSDPIAYRLEPLVLKHYSTKAPLEIQKSNEIVTKMSYKEMNEKRSALNIDLKSALTRAPSNKKKEKDSKTAELNKISNEEVAINYNVSTTSTSTITMASTKTSTSVGTPSSNPNQIDQVELESALDYQLQDSSFEFVAAFKAHTSYWRSADTAFFIMQQLCLSDHETSMASSTLTPSISAVGITASATVSASTNTTVAATVSNAASTTTTTTTATTTTMTSFFK